MNLQQNKTLIFAMKSLVYAVLALLFFACSDEEHIFTQSPAERIKTHIKALEDELTQAPFGWKMVYFSRTDSLLFTTPKKVVKTIEASIERRVENEGFGGHYFVLKFQKGGKVSMQADYDEQSIENSRESNYRIEQNSNVQLSFTTHNYLHKLVNDKFRGVSDFLYVGKDSVQNLVFKTNQYIESAREYIVLEKLKKAEDTLSYITKAYENRKFFENMKNPQLSIHRGSREYFHSDVYLKNNVHNTNDRFLQAIEANRYYVFEYDVNPSEILAKRKKSQFIGSGYVGTEKGLSFHAGLRYDKTIIFYDFVRKGDRFVSKLYDKNGVDTGCVAEIWDEEVKE